MNQSDKNDWIEKEHKFVWFSPINWDKFVEFIGGDPNHPVWPGKGSNINPEKNEPGHSSGHVWQEWWRFYWSWNEQFNNEPLPDNLPDWAKPVKKLNDDEIQYWMKHWRSFVSRHWKAWKNHGQPVPSNEVSSIEYNAIVAWGADPENPPEYVHKLEEGE